MQIKEYFSTGNIYRSTKRLLWHLSLFIIPTMIFIFGAIEAHCIDPAFKFGQKRIGDFDEMVKKNEIRVLMSYSKTFYFIDGADQRGFSYDTLKEFEKYINQKLNRKALKIRLFVIPTTRDRLLPALIEGVGDIAVSNLTITEERLKKVDFSIPLISDVDEIIVSSPDSTPLQTIEDLSGRKIYVRKSSSYHESLQHLNTGFKAAGKKPIKIVYANELLEDEDLLEMMNAGLIPTIAIDSHKAKLWAKIFKKLTYHWDLKIRTGSQIGWAIRKNSPKLKKEIDAFAKKHKVGTTFGNIMLKRYLESTKWIQNAHDEKEIKRFNATLDFFMKYSSQYEFDWVMIAALAYQESRIDQSKRSPAGAIGVMQLLPSTARDPNVNIPNIEKLENNIHAGVKYLRFLRQRYFDKEPMDDFNRMLFSFASYNAGPQKIAKIRKETQKTGLNPNVWFRNVEIIAARRIGQETVQYVSNIYKYYTAYRLLIDKKDLKAKAKEKITQ